MGLAGVQGWAPSTEVEDATEGKAGTSIEPESRICETIARRRRRVRN
jgi:hypothetical protein